MSSVCQAPFAWLKYLILWNLIFPPEWCWFVNLKLTFLQASPNGTAAGVVTGLAWTSELSFGSVIVSAPRMSAVATANVILFIALLLFVSLSAGSIENL